MSYIGTEPKDIRSFGRTKFDYTATQGQTAFTGADDDGKVLAFTAGQIEVYVNGILMDDSDFTTTGTGTVTLASAANLNDVINIVSFETNIPDSNYVPATGGTFTGDVTHTGAFTSQGIDDNANATAITIDSSENVLVGTTTTTNLISGTGNDGVILTPNHIEAARDGGAPLFLNRTTSDGTIAEFRKDGTTVGSIGSYVSGSNNYLSIGNADTGMLFNAANDAFQPWNITSNVGRDSAIDIGRSSARWKDLYLSGGAYIGGTGNSNYLDDYEEGTWTMAPYSLNSTIQTAYNVRKYVKVGSLVTVSIYARITSVSGTNAFYLTLPFTSGASISNNNNSFAGGVMYENIDVGSTGLTWYISAGQNYMRFYQLSDNGSWDSLKNSDLNTSSALYLSATYNTF